jgi:hypothetical protein
MFSKEMYSKEKKKDKKIIIDIGPWNIRQN